MGRKGKRKVIDASVLEAIIALKAEHADQLQTDFHHHNTIGNPCQQKRDGIDKTNQEMLRSTKETIRPYRRG